MSILIKGMEMPRSCNECRFAVDGFCYAYPKQANGDALNKRQRTNWCPLIHVPDHHGRWIFKVDSSWHGGSKYECSACKYGYATGAYHEPDDFTYCPHCGAKMDGGEND